jgi:hypothetical protein
MRTVVLLVMAAVLSGAASGLALAQAEGPLFVSPMGEPFRRENGVAPVQVWFMTADADHDGKVSHEEFVAQARTFFASTLDANQDGSVTSIESTGLYRERAPEVLSTRTAPLPTRRAPESGLAGARDRPQRERNEPPATGAVAYGLLDVVEPVMSCDADLSRRVTPAEFDACAARRFALLDVDRDGFFAVSESPRATALLRDSAEQRE